MNFIRKRWRQSEERYVMNGYTFQLLFCQTSKRTPETETLNLWDTGKRALMLLIGSVRSGSLILIARELSKQKGAKVGFCLNKSKVVVALKPLTARITRNVCSFVRRTRDRRRVVFPSHRPCLCANPTRNRVRQNASPEPHCFSAQVSRRVYPGCSCMLKRDDVESQ